jgi:pimeloyl-ACP methyl ester carboxylesterase
MPQRAGDHATVSFEQAERRLLAACGMEAVSRPVRLADPPLSVRGLEAGEGPPLVLVHGSGMSAATWAPLLPYLGTRRLIACDLPGFGTQRRIRPQRPAAASARGGPAHLAAGRARPRAGADRRHLAGRDVGTLPGPRRTGSRGRRGVARGPRRRPARHARRFVLHGALHARPAPAGRTDPVAERAPDGFFEPGSTGYACSMRARKRSAKPGRSARPGLRSPHTRDTFGGTPVGDQAAAGDRLPGPGQNQDAVADRPPGRSNRQNSATVRCRAADDRYCRLPGAMAPGSSRASKSPARASVQATGWQSGLSGRKRGRAGEPVRARLGDGIRGRGSSALAGHNAAGGGHHTTDPTPGSA